MLKNSFRTCIACDDPINQEGFNLHVCEKCLQEKDGKRASGKGSSFQARDGGESAAEERVDG